MSSWRRALSGAILAVIAVLAFAGTGSAATFTSPEGTTYTGSLVATSTNSKLEGAFVAVECSHSELKASVEQHGSVNAGGNVSSLTFTGCNYTTHILNAGTVTSDSTGTLWSTGGKITVQTSVGHCIFTTNNTDIGNLVEGSGGVLALSSSKIPRTGGNFLCGSSGTWTGSYDLTTPNDLWVD